MATGPWPPAFAPLCSTVRIGAVMRTDRAKDIQLGQAAALLAAGDTVYFL